MNCVVPLDYWFRELEPAAAKYSGVLAVAAETARYLLATQRDITILHGDIHHGNILDFGRRGWLAIDPKGLRGERAFDYANLFCNPDLKTAAAPERLTTDRCSSAIRPFTAYAATAVGACVCGFVGGVDDQHRRAA